MGRRQFLPLPAPQNDFQGLTPCRGHPMKLAIRCDIRTILASAVLLALSAGTGLLDRGKAAQPAVAKDVFFQDSRTDWKIYLSPQADPTEQFAAEELRDALKKISGATFEVVTSQPPPMRQAIILGDL